MLVCIFAYSTSSPCKKELTNLNDTKITCHHWWYILQQNCVGMCVKPDKCKSPKQENYKAVEELLANLVSPYNPSHGDSYNEGTLKRKKVIENNNQNSSSAKKTTSIFIGISGISSYNNPFWGIHIFGNSHISWLVFSPHLIRHFVGKNMVIQAADLRSTKHSDPHPDPLVESPAARQRRPCHPSRTKPSHGPGMSRVLQGAPRHQF